MILGLCSAPVYLRLPHTWHQPSNAVHSTAAMVRQQSRFQLSLCDNHETSLRLRVRACIFLGSWSTQWEKENGSISASLILLCCLMLLYMYHALVQALDIVTAMVQQQPHLERFPLWQPLMVCSCLCVSARVGGAILTTTWTTTAHTPWSLKHPCSSVPSLQQRTVQPATNRT